MYAKIISFVLLVFTASTVSSLKCIHCDDCDNTFSEVEVVPETTDCGEGSDEQDVACVVYQKSYANGDIVTTHKKCAEAQKGKDPCHWFSKYHACKSCNTDLCNQDLQP